ncbi:MAG: GNVR domain-containing protein [Woeseia sp.]
MSVALILTILRAHWFLILASLGVAIFTAVLLTSAQDERYEAVASVIVDYQAENPFNNSSISPRSSGSYMATQLDIIRSDKVAARVLERVDIARSPELTDGVSSAATSSGAGHREELLSQLKQNLDVSAGYDNSQMIKIGYNARDPETAAQIANAFAAAYIATSLELSREPLQQNAAWFDEQIQVLRRRLRAAEARLTEFQQEQGIVALDEKLDTETERLREVSSSLVEAQSNLFDVQSRQLGANHPEYRRAVAREGSLQQSVDEQKQRILSLMEQRDTLGALAREVQNEKSNYEATLQNYYRISLESQFNQTNISILSAALPPDEPSSPNLALNLAGAGLLGLALPIALLFGLEMSRRKIRSDEDIEKLLGTRLLETV